MHPTHTPLFATTCLGATISHVQVFPMHITYQQRFGRDISVASDMIASVENRVYEYGYVILSTTSRRRIICMVQRKHADALCGAIRDAYDPPHNHQSGFRAEKAPLRSPTTNTTAALNSKRVEHGRRPTPPVFPPKESKHSRA
jgi:hypothetical protein